MDIEIKTLLQAEIYLENYGFERLHRWKIGGQNYFIQLCPNREHVCILTSSMVKSLLSSKMACRECDGELWRNLSEKILNIGKHEHILNLLFQLNIKYPKSQTALEIEKIAPLQEKFEEYKHIRDKHFRENLSILAPINSHELNELTESNELNECWRYDKLQKANQYYMQLIVKLEQENHRLRDKIKFYEELIEEKCQNN